MLLYDYIIYPIEMFYRIMYLLLADWLGNYGFAVIILSLLNFLILYPFTKIAHELQQEEIHLQGILEKQILEIKERYSGAEQFEKIKRLYDRYSYHPIMAIRSILGLLIQLPFLLAAFYMLSRCSEIQGVSWGIIPNLSKPDGLLNGINVLPFFMTLVSVIYAFLMPGFDRKQIIQTVIVSGLFLILLYSAPSALLVFWTCNVFWSFLNSVLSKKLQRISNFVKENELAFHIVFALALTVGLLVPSEIYIKNANQLWFSYKDIAKFFLKDISKYLCILLFVYIICRHRKIKFSYLSILLGVLLGVFLQSYVIGLDYGTFNGREIEWEKYAITGLINTLIWFFCLVASFFVFKYLKFDSVRINKFVKPITFGVILIQCIVLILTLKNNPIQKDIVLENGKTNVLTIKDMYTVSSKDNIIVFLLDSFDAAVFEEIIEKNPEVLDGLEGFVYYPDTASSFGYTYYSLPEILTGIMYDPRNSYSEYLQKSWKETPYYRFLKEKKYTINIYTSGRYVAEKTAIDNISVETIKLNDDLVGYFKSLAKFRMVPHYLKNLYYKYRSDTFNSAVLDEDCKTYVENDRAFFVDLKKKFKVNKDTNFFKFYHLNGIHGPFVLNENVELVKREETGYYKQAIGSLKIVKDFIALMKQYNIYNNATFIIMADHGKQNEIGSRPIFLVKQPGRIKKELLINHRPMRIGELMPLLFQRFTGVKSDNEVLADANKRVYYLESGKQFVKYHVKSPAKSISSWISLGQANPYNVLDRKYEIGEIIDFSFDGNSRKYKNSGWREKEDWKGTLIFGHEADIFLDIKGLEKINNGVIIKVTSGAYLRKLVSRKVKMLINNQVVKNWEFKNNGWNYKNNTNEKEYFQIDLNCEVPKELLIERIPLKVQFLTEGQNQDGDSSDYDQSVLIEKFQILNIP